jgi:acetyl-CoA synthetase
VNTVEESTNLSSSLREDRVFAPSAEFVSKAHVKGLDQYEALYRRSVDDPEGFWGEAAAELDWFAPWTKVLVGEGSRAQWFVDG